MSSMSGAEIARLVLGYLQSQQMDQVALNFAKESPYLIEEYRFLKRGIKMKPINRMKSLHEILKEYIGIEDIVTELFNDELNKHDPTSVPYELLQIKTLTDKVKYFSRNFKLLKSSTSESQDQMQSTSCAAASRKRPNISSISQNSSDSDIVEQSSGHSLQQDSLNHSRPSKRRRLIDDPDLIINEKSASKHTKTPLKELYVSMLTNNDFAVSLAQQLNEVPAGGSGVLTNQDLLDSLVSACMDDILPTAFSTSGESRVYSEEDCEIVPNEEDRELNTPIPKDSSFKGRYDLRSNRKSSLGASAESKQQNEKPQILSDERVDILPTSVISQCRSEPIELSDSDTDAVTTTSHQQPQQQMQQQFYIQIPQQQTGGFKQIYDSKSGEFLLIRCENPIAQSQPLALYLPQYQAATSTVKCPVETITTNTATTSNVIDDSQFTVNVGSQLVTMVMPNQNCATMSDEESKRIIVINSDDVITEGSQTVQTMELDPPVAATDTLKTATKPPQNANEQQTENEQIEKEKTDSVAPQLEQSSSQKVVTPKQLIKSNIPSSSRSLSTPRNRNPHVRVLDFNCTPNRFRLSEINEDKNESFSNTSRFFNETPHNRSIVSSLPSSAPPKVDTTSVQRRQISMQKSIESSTADAFVPSDENTRISVDGETPKVRKSNRRSCVRSISSHKENHPDEERSKRVAATKKKICADDGENNASDKTSETKQTLPTSNEDAMAEWERMRNARKNPELFEQRLREEYSKKQSTEHSTVRKKRPTRSKKKPAATAAVKKKQTDDNMPDDSTKPENTSLNSTIDPDLLNSTQLNLEAQMLEDNLKSTKNATPVKPLLHKSSKKKTPNRKLQIKLMPSPKNKALKRLRSAKNLVSANEKVKGDMNVHSSISSERVNEPAVAAESSSSSTKKQTESELVNQLPAEASEKSVDLQNSKDIEASQILIGMPEMIKKQEIERRKSQNQDIQHEAISMSQQPVEAPTEPIKMPANEPMEIDKSHAVLLQNIRQPNMSMSSLLETPFKDCGMLLPRTPNLSSILAQMNTPMMRYPDASLLNDSILKNPNWPTPSFPLTPGAMFGLTPFKDLVSPRNEDIVYGAPNRPTDYSSSSSYYKPDESDGIDRQIQASIASGRKNSDVYSADDLNESSKVDDTTQNTSRSSSSSSSSSSDSSSDSDSDSDSTSSSDSEGEKGDENYTPDHNEQKNEQLQHHQHQQLKQQPPEDLIDDSNTQEIKSHLVTTSHIAQNILLSEPSAPIVKQDEEQSKLLNEKLRRMQETIRKDEMKNQDKLKPKQTKKYNRAITEAKRDRLRGVQAISSPSKRKSTQPKKIISIHSQQVYSEVVNVQAGSQSTQVVETKVHQTIISERLNVMANAHDTPPKPQSAALQRSSESEETLEAIQKHIATNVEHSPREEASTSKKSLAVSVQLSKANQNLIEMLSEKQKKLDANKPKAKTEVIEALPLTRATRSRARNQRTAIAPAKNIITQPAATKPTDSSKVQRRSKENKPAVNSNLTNTSHKEKPEPKPAEPSTTEVVKSNSEFVFETPAKQKESRQKIRDLFGDCTDIETPIKSPPRMTTRQSLGASQEPDNENRSKKVEADSSNVKDDSSSSSSSSSSDDSDESDSDEEEYEMVFVDETDKKRVFNVYSPLGEKTSVVSETAAKSMVIGKKKVVLPGNIHISLEPSDVMELYTQDIDSVVEEGKNKKRARSTKEAKSATSANVQADSDSKYGKPLHTSTPSPPKSITPKFTVKHKPTTMLSPKSGQKTNNFNSIQIDDILNLMHPATE